MIGSETDRRNIELAKMLMRLQDHIDIHRVIGINVTAIKECNLNSPFLGYLQMTALECLSLQIAKIFERQGRNQKNSIPGIIDTLGEDIVVADTQLSVIDRFCNNYGEHDPSGSIKNRLNCAYACFMDQHKKSFSRIKYFRDKISAHSDAGASIKGLPSHVEFESIYEFGHEFYSLISDQIVGVTPASFQVCAGIGFMQMLESLGVGNLKFDFDVEVT